MAVSLLFQGLPRTGGEAGVAAFLAVPAPVGFVAVLVPAAGLLVVAPPDAGFGGVGAALVPSRGVLLASSLLSTSTFPLGQKVTVNHLLELLVQVH